MGSIPKFTHDLPGKVFNVAGRRLTGGRWTRMRNAWMRAYPRCVDCGRPGEEVHHIVPRAVAPNRVHDDTNIETLCKECHARRHGKHA